MSIISTFAGGVESVAEGHPLSGVVSGAANSLAGVGLNAISSWVLDGTKSALEAVSRIIGTATAPNLSSTWFSATYWRVAALAAVLTMPFLFAAAVQALMRSDLALLTKAVFGYLPLSLLGVSVAAPVSMLLLAATDQMSAVVGVAGTQGGTRFLDQAAAAAGASTAIVGSPFFAVVIGACAVMAAIMLALELLVREAAVYVVVLMLPIAFAAMVWPARRIWAVRLTELLISLILSKFVIVAVLSLAGAAFAHGTPGVSELLVAMALLMLSVFAPWTLVRILPFSELAASAAGSIRRDLPQAAERAQNLGGAAAGFGDGALTLPARLRQHAAGTDDHGSSGFPTSTFSSAGTENSRNRQRTPDPPPGGSVESSLPDLSTSAAEPDATRTDPQSSAFEQSVGSTKRASTAAPTSVGGRDSSDNRAPLTRPWAHGDSETPLNLDSEFVKRGFDTAPPPEIDTASNQEDTPGVSHAASSERLSEADPNTEGLL